MRTFYYDPETKLPMLNGGVYYLRGTNVAMHRFYEDPQREQHPWEENWARALYREFKDVGWVCSASISVSPLPSGMMLPTRKAS